jgi:hypothetical protein
MKKYAFLLLSICISVLPVAGEHSITPQRLNRQDRGAQAVTVRAKTVKEDTIDGITAPWYLIAE